MPIPIFLKLFFFSIEMSCIKLCILYIYALVLFSDFLLYVSISG